VGLGVVWLEAVVVPGKGNGTQYKIVTFETASRKGEPFEDVIKKYGLPSKLYRHCTRELKEVPIHRYAKKILGKKYMTAIGIRADEKHRLGSNPKMFYPLAEVGVTEEIVRNWWDTQSFDLDLKDYEGNCDLCFLKSVRKKLTLLKDKPLLAEWWNDMEMSYARDNQPILDVYRGLSIHQLVTKAQEEFKPAVDQHELSKSQPSLFEFDMDLEFDCFCKMN
jgi:3'-phosphoadenosine 5'-phosphosulfate sulfotransferase (PAPS reductase)/FAD synthetase